MMAVYDSHHTANSGLPRSPSRRKRHRLPDWLTSMGAGFARGIDGDADSIDLRARTCSKASHSTSGGTSPMGVPSAVGVAAMLLASTATISTMQKCGKHADDSASSPKRSRKMAHSVSAVPASTGVASTDALPGAAEGRVTGAGPHSRATGAAASVRGLDAARVPLHMQSRAAGAAVVYGRTALSHETRHTPSTCDSPTTQCR